MGLLAYHRNGGVAEVVHENTVDVGPTVYVRFPVFGPTGGINIPRATGNWQRRDIDRIIDAAGPRCTCGLPKLTNPVRCPLEHPAYHPPEDTDGPVHPPG